MATAYLEQQPGNRLTNLHCMKSKEAFMNGSKNIFNTVANLRVDRNLNLQEQIARRAYELWQARGSTSGNDWSDLFRAESELNEWHKRRTRKAASCCSD